MEKIIDLIQADSIRKQVLFHTSQLNLPDCYVAAGFVRNLVWDSLHGFTEPTPLNDVDIIYFDTSEENLDAYKYYEQILTNAMPSINWQVRNQAYMHSRNGDKPYKSSLDAMSYWPEKETAIAIRMINSDSFECVAAFLF